MLPLYSTLEEFTPEANSKPLILPQTRPCYPKERARIFEYNVILRKFLASKFANFTDILSGRPGRDGLLNARYYIVHGAVCLKAFSVLRTKKNLLLVN